MLKKLEKYLESEKKDKNIFDIVIYGSFVKGKTIARDLDIVVIFLEGTLRERLTKIQEIKSRLKLLHENIDIKQITLKDLFSTDFFARTGILIEGISMFRKKTFSEILGFKTYALFWYNLKDLTHTQKVRFNYILAGRNEMKGIIEDLDGQRIVSGAIKIPIEHSLEFEEILKRNNVKYERKDILEAV